MILPLIPITISSQIGYIDLNTVLYILNAIINVIFSAMARGDLKRVKFKYNKPLLHPDSRPPFTIKTALILLVYFIGKVCLFLWLYNNVGITGFLQLFWIGFTLLEPNIYASMRVTKFLLMPVLVFSYYISYLIAF